MLPNISFAQTEALIALLDKAILPSELKLSFRKVSSTPEKTRKISRTTQKKSFKLSCELFIKFAVEHLKAIPPNWSGFFHVTMQQNQAILEKQYILERMEAYHYYAGW